MTSTIHNDEQDIFTQDINQALRDCFAYKLEGLVKHNDRIKDEVLLLVNRFENIATNRDDCDDGELDPYGGATDIFDTFGDRYPTDYWGDDIVHDTLKFLAKWILFSRDVIKRCREIGFKNDSWVNLALDHYQTGRHDT
jgi:hypothetical protein